MKKLYFENIEHLCLDIVDKFENLLDEDGDIVVLAKYEVAREVITKLCAYYTLVAVDLHDPEWDEYEREYIISLNSDGIWCSQVFIEDHYINDEPNILYVHQDCNSRALKTIKGSITVEFQICELDCECGEDCLNCDDEYDDEFYCDSDCENYELEPTDTELAAIADEEDNLHGFTYSSVDDDVYHSVSFYTSENLDSNRIKELIELFGII